MKRSGPPPRRTPLKAKTPLPRGRALTQGSARLAKAGKPRARAAIRARSAKREESRDVERNVRLAVFARDGHRCVLEGRACWGPCAGPLTFGHLRKAGQGGAYEPANGVTQCARHNSAIEDRPVEAHALGLVVRAGETLDAAWDRMRAAGLVAWGQNGAPPAVP